MEHCGARVSTQELPPRVWRQWQTRVVRRSANAQSVLFILQPRCGCNFESPVEAWLRDCHRRMMFASLCRCRFAEHAANGSVCGASRPIFPTPKFLLRCAVWRSPCSPCYLYRNVSSGLYAGDITHVECFSHRESLNSLLFHTHCCLFSESQLVFRCLVFCRMQHAFPRSQLFLAAAHRSDGRG